MHTLPFTAAIVSLLLMTSACSSGLDEAQPLAIGTQGSDAAFSHYEKDADGFVDATELYRGETDLGATRVTSPAIAAQILGDYDLDGNGRLDNLEFAGLVHSKILVGTLHHPEWIAPAPRH